MQFFVGYFKYICFILLIILSSCTKVPDMMFDKPVSFAITDPETNDLGRIVLNLTKKHQNYSGFQLLNEGSNGLAWRIASAGMAPKKEQ